MKYLITGACGFIGSNFADLILKDQNNSVLNIDKHTSVSNSFLATKYHGVTRYQEYVMDLAIDDWQNHIKIPDIVIHFAAESHVDRSCEDVMPFIQSNIIASMNIANFCIKHDIPLVYISTDEVYGELEDENDYFTENTPINPRNPYSATKAGGEFLLKSLANVAGYRKYIITRCSNNYGPWQDKTKFIPVCIKNLMDGKKIPVYGQGKQVRDWIHVLDHCEAIYLLSKNLQKTSDIIPHEYNIGANNEKSNIQIAHLICDIMDVPYDKGIKFIKDPRGSAHDFRYAIDNQRLHKLYGWSAKHSHPFEDSMKQTIEWYKHNSHWVF